MIDGHNATNLFGISLPVGLEGLPPQTQLTVFRVWVSKGWIQMSS